MSRSRALCLGVLMSAAVAACAGSSSESPWPVEPNEVDPGPAGEGPIESLDMRKVPNRYPAPPDAYGASGGGSPVQAPPQPATPSPEESGAAP